STLGKGLPPHCASALSAGASGFDACFRCIPHFGQLPAVFDFTSGCIGQLYSRVCSWAKLTPVGACELIARAMPTISTPSKRSFTFVRFILLLLLKRIELSNPV